MTEFADVNRVIELLGCSQAMAYKAIRTLNGELKEKGFLTIQGKVNENYLRERYGLEKIKTSANTDQSNTDVQTK
ncbi:LysR family transcriptional regulator [Fusobacterium nucleatum]|uniref:LysR family transcriptional regulator n=1 Tax=Fusobacterium nucleatum TaxID=851 RepID=UPI0030D485FA